MSKINGDTLLGFGDFFSENHVAQSDEGVGAMKPTIAPPVFKTHPRNADAIGAKPPAPPKPAKQPKYKQGTMPKPPATTGMSTHGKVLHASHAVATKAVNSVMKAVKVLADIKAAAKNAKPIVAHIGAAVVDVAKQGALTPKAKMAIQKHDLAAKRANKANQTLAQHAVATKKAVATLATHMVGQRRLATKMKQPNLKAGVAATHVGEMLSDPVIGEAVAEALGEYYTSIGADPDPNNPGFLTDGTPDPAFAASADPSLSTSDTSLSDLSAASDPVSFPPPVSIDTVLPGNMADYGGIAYNGMKGTPQGYVVSNGLAYRTSDHSVEPDTAQIDGTEHFGYVWGTYDFKAPEKGILWGSNLAKDTWNHVHGRYHLGDSGWHEPCSLSDALASPTKNTTSQPPMPYGPLIGNPALRDFVGMRVDNAGNMFWLPQEAPDWLTFPLRQAAALTAQAAQAAAKLQAATDAATAAAAAAATALAQSQQDAANALAESQAASQAKQATSQATGDQAAVETQAQQQVVAQAAQQLAEQQQAAPLLAQQAQLNLQQQQQPLQVQQQMIDYAASHPDEAYGPSGDEGGGDDGGDGGGGDGGGGDDGGGDDGGGDDGGGDDGGGEEAVGLDAFDPPLPGQGANDFEWVGTAGQFDDGLGIPGGDQMGDFDGEGFND